MQDRTVTCAVEPREKGAAGETEAQQSTGTAEEKSESIHGKPEEQDKAF